MQCHLSRLCLDPIGRKTDRGPAKSHGHLEGEVIRDSTFSPTQPNKRFATVEELGALSVFLSTDAGASITGTPCRSTAAGRRIDASDWLRCVDRNVFVIEIQRS